jgi:hypothetical protein
MTTFRRASPRPAAAAGLTLATVMWVTACTSNGPQGDATSPSASATPTVTLTPAATPTPSPSPEPTPRFTNEPDTELAELIPSRVAGRRLVVAPFDEFALTPGDVAIAYGELGTQFGSLVVAYVEEPRTTLYAMRVDGPQVSTADLRPHLATAGRYVGIAGLDPEPWDRARVDGTRVWVRPEDNATAAGTHIYTWSSGDIVFLLIGVDDSLNRAIVSALPGEAAPSPSSDPSGSPSPSAEPSATPGG